MRQNRHAPVRHSLRERATDRLGTAVATLCDSHNDRSLSNVVVILNAGRVPAHTRDCELL